MAELGRRVEAVAESILRDEARQLGRRSKKSGRWQVEVPVRCVISPSDDPWDETDEGFETDVECGCRPVTIGEVLLPACRGHLALWAARVGFSWAARVGVIPYAAEFAGLGCSVYGLSYPAEPARSPLPCSRSKPGSYVEVTHEEFEMLTDALLEIGAPVAEIFALGRMADKAEREGDWSERVRLHEEGERVRQQIVDKDGRWKAMRKRAQP